MRHIPWVLHKISVGTHGAYGVNLGNRNYREVYKTKAANTFNEDGEMEWTADGWGSGVWQEDWRTI